MSVNNFGSGLVSINVSTWNDSIDMQVVPVSPQLSVYWLPSPNKPFWKARYITIYNKVTFKRSLIANFYGVYSYLLSQELNDVWPGVELIKRDCLRRFQSEQLYLPWQILKKVQTKSTQITRLEDFLFCYTANQATFFIWSQVQRHEIIQSL